MTGKSTVEGTQQFWADKLMAKVARLESGAGGSKVYRNRHLLIITAVMVLCIFQYYVDQTHLTSLPFFGNTFFTGIHDVNRVLFLVPILYAALAFRVRGSIFTSFVFLVTVLPRALFFSTYPNPLLRALVFVAFAALVGFFVAFELNRSEKEERINTELKAANEKLSEYAQQLKDSQEQLIQSEKLSSLGELAASIAHEVNNPLTGVLNYTQLLAKRIEGDRFSKERALHDLSLMELELIRTTKLVRNLLDFARQSAPQLMETDLNDVFNRTLELTAHAARQSKTEVIKEFDPSLPKLMVDPSQIQQVCTNLIMNAIQAMPGGGRLFLRTSLDNGWLKMEVQDTGCGISPENMHKLFTPFFTTKREVKGVGLGLAVSYGIIQRHHGKIEVQSAQGEGSTFTIFFPIDH
jgi:signal transduction histidine kinase